MNAPASTFEHEGKQYVVALSAGNALVGTAKGDSVWLFGLDGTLPPAAERDSERLTTAVPPAAESPATAAVAAATPASASAAPPPAAAAALAAQGAEVFTQACVVCHGEDGLGGHGGGAPLDQIKDVALVIATVSDGRGNMPAFGGALTSEQIRAVAAFVVNDLFE
jgi:mono/diheme cytochrome c family protein